MWRCSYCGRRFEDRDDGINHARAQHSRDYTTCEHVPQWPRESGALQSVASAIRTLRFMMPRCAGRVGASHSGRHQRPGGAVRGPE